MNTERRIVVLGVGNVLCSDDGVGITTVRQLKKDCWLPAEVELIDGGTLGLDLLHVVAGATHLLIIDAVSAGREPGEVFELHDLAGVRGGGNAHDLGGADLLAALRLIDQAPEHFHVLAVQPADTGVGTNLSRAVSSAMPSLLESVARQVELWIGCGSKPSTPPA